VQSGEGRPGENEPPVGEHVFDIECAGVRDGDAFQVCARAHECAADPLGLAGRVDDEGAGATLGRLGRSEEQGRQIARFGQIETAVSRIVTQSLRNRSASAACKAPRRSFLLRETA
jgi:hypothetical protein